MYMLCIRDRSLIIGGRVALVQNGGGSLIFMQGKKGGGSSKFVQEKNIANFFN